LQAPSILLGVCCFYGIYCVQIVQIYKDYPPVIGGIEHHIRDLAEALVGRGHEVTVLVTSLDRHTTVERHGRLKIIRAARMLHAASTPLSLEMLRIARTLSADIVHVHFPYPLGDLAAGLVLGAPRLVVTYHSDIVRQQNLLRLYQPLLHHTLRRAAQIIATSPAYMTSSPFLRRYAATCTVVPLGIRPERLVEPSSTQIATMRKAFKPEPIALFIGRLRYYKGLHIAIEALCTAPGVQLVIGGTGPEYPRLVAQAQQMGVAERVHFIGDVAEAQLVALYYASDFFVLPAHVRAEAFGIAQLEALACGLPCISTELGTGTSWANQHGETGLVVPPGDVAALASAMRTLAADTVLRKRYGARARQRVLEQFTVERMVDGVERVYHACMAGGHAGSIVR
jgi:glycosyltransferase involved in cell wall biosynthesis